VSHHPGRSSKEASHHFLDVASTPPHEEGNTSTEQFGNNPGPRRGISRNLSRSNPHPALHATLSRRERIWS